MLLGRANAVRLMINVLLISVKTTRTAKPVGLTAAPFSYLANRILSLDRGRIDRKFSFYVGVYVIYQCTDYACTRITIVMVVYAYLGSVVLGYEDRLLTS